MPVPYERPELKDLGSLQALTAQDKDFTGNDGLTLQGAIIGNSS